MPFDVEQIRKKFPILKQEINDHPLVYLDNASSSQKPKSVITAMSNFMEQDYSNVHRGLHSLSNRATDKYEAARDKVASFLGCSQQDVVFTSNSTAAMNLVSYSFLSPHIEEGDEIVISKMDHHSNIVPWYFLQERQQAKLKWVNLTEDGDLDLEHLSSLLNNKTKLVSLPHISNVLGTVNPIKKISSIIKKTAGQAMFFIDGSQGSAHCSINVRDLGCDFYAITGHKLYGPTGIGALYISPDIFPNKFQPFFGGGEMINHVGLNHVTYNHMPHRFEAGTPPIVEAIGLAAAINFVEQVGIKQIANHEKNLTEYAIQQLYPLSELGYKFYGKSKTKTSIFSFTHSQAHGHDIASLLDARGIAVRAGNHCAMPLHSEFNISSSSRASFAIFNTSQEIDKLKKGLENIAKIFKNN